MNVKDLLESFKSKRVLVIGDTIIDIATHCDAIGISAETPTMVLRKKPYDERRMQYDEVTYGGAALVVRNLLELGASVDFLTFAGSGAWETDLERWKHPNLKNNLVYAQTELKKPVTVKHRFWADGYKMLQVDTRNDVSVDEKTESAAIQAFQNLTEYNNHSAIVISDYRHGFITRKMASWFSSGMPMPVFISSQVSQNESNHDWYSSRATFVLNERELEKYRPSKFVVTKGENGCSYLDEARNTVSVQSGVMVDVADTCGAGDAFLAMFSLCDTKWAYSLEYANVWAALSCTVNGANPPTKDMLINWYERHGKIAA